jgi:hypothetical protein
MERYTWDQIISDTGAVRFPRDPYILFNNIFKPVACALNMELNPGIAAPIGNLVGVINNTREILVGVDHEVQDSANKLLKFHDVIIPIYKKHDINDWEKIGHATRFRKADPIKNNVDIRLALTKSKVAFAINCDFI